MSTSPGVSTSRPHNHLLCPSRSISIRSAVFHFPGWSMESVGTNRYTVQSSDGPVLIHGPRNTVGTNLPTVIFSIWKRINVGCESLSRELAT